MRTPRRQFANFIQHTEGSSFVEIALLLPFLLLLFVGAVDLGRLYFMCVEITGAAQAGALYGVQNPGDTSGMQSAASAGASSLSGITTTATYGCECSDGSSRSASCGTTPTCTYNYVNYVDVASSVQYSPIFSYPGLPSTMTLTREAKMRVGSN